MTTARFDLDALWDSDRPGASEKRFRDHLAELEALGDEDALAEALTQLARAEGLQRRFGDAHRTLDEVEQTLERTGARARIRYLLERGRLLNSESRPSDAQPLFLQAWETARTSAEDGLAVDAAHMLAIVMPGPERDEWNDRALRLAETSRDPKARKWAASLYNNIGWSWFESGAYDRALDAFDAALEHARSEGHLAKIRIGRWSVARTLRAMAQLEDALVIQRALLEEMDAHGERDGFVCEEIAECLEALGRTDEAKPFFTRAYHHLSTDPDFAERGAARLERLRRLGGIDNGVDQDGRA